MSSLNDKYAIVPVVKASNNVVLFVKVITINVSSKNLTFSKSPGNSTYKNTRPDKAEMSGSYKSFMSSMNIPINDEYDDVPTIYWIPKLPI